MAGQKRELSGRMMQSNHEIAAKAAVAAPYPQKGDMVMTKNHGRGVILDKKGGNYNILLDKKDHRGRSWQQFFELEEITILGCGSCANQLKDCGPCSAELRRKVFAPQAVAKA